VTGVESRVAPDAEEAGVTLVLEPLNTAVDHPGYYLTSTAEGIEIVEEVGSPSVQLLYDVYHQQITEGNVIDTITDHVEHIGHIHIADVPGRHEPGTGELNYANVFDAIDDADYEGYVGCEFSPTGDPDAAMADVLELR
jgi:hydroxypyruvate isomerase